MSFVEILSVEQPCVLCEQALEVWHITRDEETGEERIEREPAHHVCPQMQALLRERRHHSYQPRQ
jgi:hypothetical protein